MSLPLHTRSLLYAGGAWDLPGNDHTACEGAAFHSPRPLFVAETPLVRREWWPEDGDPYWQWAPRAWMCGTCADNLAILLQMLHATDGRLEWPIRREFGNGLRALAEKGWRYFSSHRPARPEPAAP